MPGMFGEDQTGPEYAPHLYNTDGSFKQPTSISPKTANQGASIMQIDNIEKVYSLLHALKAQRDKLEKLERVTNIHVTMNGPSLSQAHINFSRNTNHFENLADTSEYDWNDGLKFITEVIKDRIETITDMLNHYGVTIDE